ncbi:MAG TPA: YggS family pyridoxal phosphate-dependent enzyme [Longimicrobiales bacterium]|nr:YggS family pyridoxal phosphate-dependent enzyme [Longimicrobiales bacterium]
MYENRLKEALPRVREAIAGALERAGRSEHVEIVAITKGHPADAVLSAVRNGLRCCGENRAAELEAKVGAVGRHGAEWHFVGHLQRNKVRRILPLVDLLHSVDSLRLAETLSAEAVRAGMTLRVLVQVNTSGEAAKGGFSAAEAVDAVARIAELPNLAVQGLMTMAPLDAEEAVLRSTFGRTRRLFDECAAVVPGFEARHLSMGMSNDFEVAVEEGSTMVRLGTILFGERRP